MASGLEDDVWTIRELIEESARFRGLGLNPSDRGDKRGFVRFQGGINVRVLQWLATESGMCGARDGARVNGLLGQKPFSY
jgi:hypothetical protein